MTDGASFGVCSVCVCVCVCVCACRLCACICVFLCVLGVGALCICYSSSGQRVYSFVPRNDWGGLKTFIRRDQCAAS